MSTSAKSQRRRVWFSVGLAVFVIVYFAVAPVFLVWYVQKRLTFEPNPAVEAVLRVVVKPATFSAARVRPYYAYWQWVGNEVLNTPMLPWEAMREKRERNQWLR